MSIRGIRGATVAQVNTKEAIVLATEELLVAIFQRNTIPIEEIASIFFSATSDLTAEFPAVAARKMGLLDTPLFCVTEVAVPDSLGKCIRVLLHVNTDLDQKDMQHVYLKEAITLRSNPCTPT